MDEREIRLRTSRRRLFLKAAVGTGIGISLVSAFYVGASLKPKKEVTPEREPLKPGDILVFVQGGGQGIPIKPSKCPLCSLDLRQKSCCGKIGVVNTSQ